MQTLVGAIEINGMDLSYLDGKEQWDRFINVGKK